MEAEILLLFSLKSKRLKRTAGLMFIVYGILVLLRVDLRIKKIRIQKSQIKKSTSLSTDAFENKV